MIGATQIPSTMNNLKTYDFPPPAYERQNPYGRYIRQTLTMPPHTDLPLPRGQRSLGCGRADDFYSS
jgi:hypothetical protein